MHIAATPDSGLLVVDVQRDFCPGGALAVPEGDAIVPRLNQYVRRFQDAGLPVYASRDWHPPGHVSFKERGGPWPPHCVQESPGAAFHPDLLLPDGVHVVNKAMDPDRDSYSAFDGTDLAERLKARGIRRLFVGGLATDYCVHASVLDALEAGFEVVFLQDASRGIDVKRGDEGRAIQEMVDRGAVAASADDVVVRRPPERPATAPQR